MIITTTPTIEGVEIIEYKTIVFGEVIEGTNFIKDIGGGLRNFFGGRAAGYESALLKAREDALAEMADRAKALGANAIVGVKIDYESLGNNGSMLMVTSSGTAVVINTR